MRVTAAALCLLAGCSFLSVRGPSPTRGDREQPRCNVSHGSVVVDGLIGITGLAMAAGTDDGVNVVGGLMGALYAGSAIYGVRANGRCERARDAYDDEMAEVERERGAERARERERERERERQAGVAPMVPPPRPPPLAVPPRPPVVAPAPARVGPPAGRVVDPFVTSAPAPRDDGEGDGDDGGDGDGESDEGEGGDDDETATPAPITRPRRPVAPAPARDDEDLETRWREFWRRLP